jgi:hypothetical protein
MVTSQLFKVADAVPAYPLSVHLRLGPVIPRSLASVPREMLASYVDLFLPYGGISSTPITGEA